MAKCPAHRERTPSLSITQMPDGIRLHCFAGCAQKDVLDALGLTWDDLRRRKLDYELMCQIRAAEEKEKAKREVRTKLLWEARLVMGYWHRKSAEYGASLAKFPDAVKLGKEFHRSLEMERRAQKVWESL